MKSPLIEKFGKSKRWVNWRLEKTKDGKLTKIPYQTKTKKASSTDEKTWNDYDTVAMAFDNGANNFSGIGIVLFDSKLVCIDIDHILNNGKIEHEQKKVIENLLKKANSFTEVSQSGTGLHIFMEMENPFTPEINKKAPYEVYTNGRYIATTDNSYDKAPKEVRMVTEEEMKEILSMIGMIKEEKKQELLYTNTTSTLNDEQLLAKMFGSKNGDDIKKTYNGDLSDHKDDASKADASLCSHLAFWSRKDKEQIRRVWLASPLGQREKTQSRADYQDRTIDHAIEACKAIYEPIYITRGLDDLDLLYNTDPKGNRIYIKNTENMARILRNHPDFKGKIRYDYFKNTTEIVDNGKWRMLEDTDTTKIQTTISILFPETFGNISEDMIYKAMMLVARENQIDSAVDYIKAIKWDGQARIDTWLCKVYGVEDNAYHRAVGSNWLKGMVKRIVIPACKFDYVLVLEGEQGIKKSTSLMTLGGDWHLETAMSTENKDFFMQFQGKAIIEFSEGETLSRTEVKRMKAIITMQSDKYRPAYGRLSVDFPRRCVFAMTTNQDEYLKDETGNRRWLPVACKKVADIEWLKENREQMLAEAYERVIVKNETTHEFPDEVRTEQEARRVKDANDEIIVDWYWNKLTSRDRAKGVTVSQAHNDCLNGNMSFGKSMNKFQEMSIANIFKNTLKLEKKRKTVGNAKTTVWFNDVDKEEDLTETIQSQIREVNNSMDINSW